MGSKNPASGNPSDQFFYIRVIVHNNETLLLILLKVQTSDKCSNTVNIIQALHY